MDDVWSEAVSLECTASSTPVVAASSFGEVDCGEPLVGQRIVLDFTPNTDLDNEYIQKKCCDFWEYIYSRDDIQNLLVEPEPIQLTDASTSSEEEEDATVSSDYLPPIKTRTAISMLEFAEEKGFIDKIFEAKIPRSQCTLGMYESEESQIGLLPSGGGKLQMCRCLGVCKKRCKKSKQIFEQSAKVKALNSQLQDWDKQHVKSMDPPHHISLSRCVLQKKDGSKVNNL